MRIAFEIIDSADEGPIGLLNITGSRYAEQFFATEADLDAAAKQIAAAKAALLVLKSLPPERRRAKKAKDCEQNCEQRNPTAQPSAAPDVVAAPGPRGSC